MNNDQSYHMLMEACQQDACPICTLVSGAVEKYISNLFYESILDPITRGKLRSSLGFCKEHAWLALDAGLSDALGFAILYQDLVKNSQENILRLENYRDCPACQENKQVTERALHVFSKYLRDKKFIEALQNSMGLCLPHLRMVSEKNPHGLDILLRIQQEKMKALVTELGEFIRKNDYRFQSEGFGTERDSYKRAIGLINGKNTHRIKETVYGRNPGWGKGDGQKKS